MEVSSSLRKQRKSEDLKAKIKVVMSVIHRQCIRSEDRVFFYENWEAAKQ